MIDQKAREIADVAARQWLVEEVFDSDDSSVIAARLGIIEGRRQAFEEAAKVADDLEHIIEYWNRDQNETAMADALWHIIETAESALAAIRSLK